MVLDVVEQGSGERRRRRREILVVAAQRVRRRDDPRARPNTGAAVVQRAAEAAAVEWPGRTRTANANGHSQRRQHGTLPQLLLRAAAGLLLLVL
jgi:hypothetical protein